MESLGQRIRKAREAAGKTQTAIAHLFNISRNAVSAWEADISKPEAAKMEKLAEFLGTTPELLAGAENTEKAQSLEPVSASAPVRTDMPLTVPVLGIAVGGNGGDFMLNGETIDYVRRPAGIAHAKGIYALYVSSTSMYPRYDDGELIYVNPNRPPSVGDDVILELVPRVEGEAGEGYIKRLVKRTASLVVVEQFNPPKQIEFEASSVKLMHRVIPWNELLGI